MAYIYIHVLRVLHTWEISQRNGDNNLTTFFSYYLHSAWFTFACLWDKERKEQH